MSHRLLSIFVLAAALSNPFQAFADPNPQAKEHFAKMITAAQAKNWADAMNSLKQAYAADPTIMAVSDNGAMDQIAAGLKAEASAKPGDVPTGKNLGWLLAVRGDFQGGLDAYKSIAAAAGEGDTEVKDQMRTLQAYVQASGGGGSSGHSTGSGGAGGAGGAGGTAGAGGSGDSGGTSGQSAGDAAAGQPAAAGDSGDAKALKDQLAKKDEEIETMTKEKEELTKKVTELEAEIKSLQIYKTRINQAGGLR